MPTEGFKFFTTFLYWKWGKEARGPLRASPLVTETSMFQTFTGFPFCYRDTQLLPCWKAANEETDLSVNLSTRCQAVVMKSLRRQQREGATPYLISQLGIKCYVTWCYVQSCTERHQGAWGEIFWTLTSPKVYSVTKPSKLTSRKHTSSNVLQCCGEWLPGF